MWYIVYHDKQKVTDIDECSKQKHRSVDGQSSDRSLLMLMPYSLSMAVRTASTAF